MSDKPLHPPMIPNELWMIWCPHLAAWMEWMGKPLVYFSYGDTLDDMERFQTPPGGDFQCYAVRVKP